MGGGAAKKVVVEPHRHEGVFVARSKNDDLLLTRNLVPGDTVYNEKKITADVRSLILLSVRFEEEFLVTIIYVEKG